MMKVVVTVWLSLGPCLCLSSPELLEVMVSIGNNKAREVYEAQLTQKGHVRLPYSATRYARWWALCHMRTSIILSTCNAYHAAAVWHHSEAECVEKLQVDLSFHQVQEVSYVP